MGRIIQRGLVGYFSIVGAPEKVIESLDRGFEESIDALAALARPQ